MSIDVRVLAEHDRAFKYPHHEESISEPEEIVPVTTTEAAIHGVWKVAQRSSAGTTIITSPPPGGSIAITDLIVSADKAATSSVQLQFTDDSETEIIALFDSINAPIAMAISLTGRLQGWEDARLELVTTGNVVANITAAYLKSPKSDPFALWDSHR